LRIADTFRARTLDSTLNSFVFEVTGNSSKVAAFVDLMRSLGEIEVATDLVFPPFRRGNQIDLES
jgi:acetolactate synthase-1/3 small subunit